MPAASGKKIRMKMFKRAISLVLLAASLTAQPARDVAEFTLFKQKSPIEVGGIQLQLKETDVSKQRYKIVVMIQNRQVEFKDVWAQVPIYFYTSDNQRQPHELIVTRVEKDQISGRLVSPVN
jgi:hypothetical protein